MSRRKQGSIDEIAAIFEALPNARLGDKYTDEDRLRDFMAVFTGQSTAEQGNMVLAQIVAFCNPFPSPRDAEKPGLLAFKEGQRWVMGELMRCFIARQKIPEVEDRTDVQPT